MSVFKVALYGTCVLTCLACTILLIRKYVQEKARLLLWSAVCFVCLTLNNVLVFADLVLYPATDFRLARLSVALLGMAFLVGGFLTEGSR